MTLRKRADWSRPLPRPLVIPKVMTLKTLADVRTLLRHLPDSHRNRSTWQHVAQQLDAASRGHDVTDAAIALRLAFMLDRVECQPA